MISCILYFYYFLVFRIYPEIFVNMDNYMPDTSDSDKDDGDNDESDAEKTKQGKGNGYYTCRLIKIK